MSARVVRALERRGIESPFAVQQRVLPDALGGADVLAASPTGSGKTLAFGIPVVERSTGAPGRPAALVLVPTRELASQVVDELAPIAAPCSLKIAAVYGGTSVGAQAKRARRAHSRRDARASARPDRAEARLAARRSRARPRRSGSHARHGLSATGRPRPARRAGEPSDAALLGDARWPRPRPRASLHRQPGASAARAHGRTGGRRDRPPIRACDARDEARPPRGDGCGADRLSLVFVRTKHGADRLARRLAREHGVRAVVMHGNMSQDARERSLAQFDTGKASTLVATDVAARGLDVAAITHVVNFDPPRTEDDYVHRVGRTGRAGRTGTGVTLILPEQRSDVAKIAERLGHADAFAVSVGRPPVQRRPRWRR